MQQPSPQSIDLLQSTHADLPVLRDLLHAAYAEYWGKLDPPVGAYQETVASLGEKLSHGQAIKAVSAGTIVGCVFFHPEATSLYFGRLAVLPAYRRHGIGRQLVDAVETYARQQKFARVTLGVRLAIPANIAYYEKLGYRIVSYSSHPGYTILTSASMEKVLS